MSDIQIVLGHSYNLGVFHKRILQECAKAFHIDKCYEIERQAYAASRYPEPLPKLPKLRLVLCGLPRSKKKRIRKKWAKRYGSIKSIFQKPLDDGLGELRKWNTTYRAEELMPTVDSVLYADAVWHIINTIKERNNNA